MRILAQITMAIAGLSSLGNTPCLAHLIGDPAHDGVAHYDSSVTPPTNVVFTAAGAGQRNLTNHTAFIAASFRPFAPKVKTHADDKFFFVESDGLPAHNLMVGITAWQQQVPLPQKYFGDNAWRFPLTPVPAAQPQSIKNNFLRGAIAIAANGIPIFNPQNNRGEISQEIGELDQWGGHCGRADDYHYHAAPLHLQSVLGMALPIAYALDGYPIYGLTEPDGSAPTKLDAFNGHSTAALGYHYHASTKYPYVNGGFHGEVTEAQQQVDPQPHAQPVRQDQPPLRGARITGFTNSPDHKTFSLKYSVNGKPGGVNYSTAGDGNWKFQFISPDGTTRDETFSAGGRRGGAGGGGGPAGRRDGGPPGRPGPDGDRPPRDRSEARPPRNEGAPVAAVNFTPRRSGNFSLQSPAVINGGALPAEFTGDGDGSTLPLVWTGAPAGTRSYALIMDHLAPGNVMKCYWTMWDIPATVTSLPKNVQDIGKLGPGFKGQIGYEPPHSQGPGPKTYVLTVYALSAPAPLNQPAREVTREVLLAAIKDSILDSAELKVVYDRSAAKGEPPGGQRAQ